MRISDNVHPRDEAKRQPGGQRKKARARPGQAGEKATEQQPRTGGSDGEEHQIDCLV
jgi:hypothetical protein